MSLIPFNRLSDVIEESVAVSARRGRMDLVVPSADAPLRLSPPEARTILYDARADPGLREAVWRQAVLLAQRETAASGPRRLLVVWLALPRLYRTMRHASFRPSVDHRDVESEAVLALLEGLKTVDPQQPRIDDILVGQACRQLWRFVRQTLCERPVADVAGVAAARAPLDLCEKDLSPPPDGWELHIDPSHRPEGLAAPLRFTASPVRAEKARLEGPAGRLGLREVVYRARRPGTGSRIGTLSLRRREGNES
ncbi:hypothetical protein [Streptomyces telluris]|uniref:Uncharacterized protein n=1 Tax=Streptomyces telluris TaxID=2720021 RepID=A0A9X2LR37_9ACTN|nr:hypothetical protein [Streptomyces telluris]MCQ8774065.1 hypothetical protein [Streptomyces telluris]NJP78015.1 hypothetical protein [Streptomyces telluris]